MRLVRQHLRKWLYLSCILALIGTCIPVSIGNVHAANEISINKNTVYQKIDGFGAAANKPVYDLMNNVPSATQNQILNFLFTNSGMNLSIVRNEINGRQPPHEEETFWPSENVITWDNDHGQKWFSKQAMDRGVTRFVGVPWTAPKWMKTNDSDYQGNIKSDMYGKLAEFFEKYVIHYANVEGINTGWVSIQNEPDANVPWVSMRYTHAEMANAVNAVKDHFVANDIWSKLLAPEGGYANNSNAYLNNMNSSTKAKVDIVAFHTYGGSSKYTTGVYNHGKPAWMTEISIYDENTEDLTIANGVYWAKDVRKIMRDGGAAYLYWWSIRADDTSQQSLVKLDSSNWSSYTIPKRSYAIGQFSRFVRPGYQRIESTSATSALKEVAFKDPTTNKAVLVVINDSSTSYTSPLSGFTASKAKVYRTSATESLTQLSDLTFSSGTANYTFPGNSITTIVEDIADSGAPASINSLAAANSNLGVTLSWTAPGDTGSVGTANRYDIRRSTSPITSSNFNSATVVKGAPAPLHAGEAQKYVVTGLTNNTTYYFAMKTRDEAGNWSGMSNVASVTVSQGGTQPPQTTTVQSAADSYIRGGSFANDNYGSETDLRVKASANAEFTRKSNIKFTLPSNISSATSAKLRLYVFERESSANVVINVFGVDSDSWTESGITWNNAPSRGSSALDTKTASAIGYIEFDVTSFVNTQLSGDKTASFAIEGNATQDRQAKIYSKESSTNKPELVITH